MKTSIDDIDKPVTIERDGKKLNVFGIPYLEPFTTASHLMEDGQETNRSERTHRNVLSAAVNRIKKYQKANPADFSVVMAHAWFAGGEGDGSEIEVNVGGIGNTPVSVLNPFDYSALGHIHKPGPINDNPNIQYSGSALPYSFAHKDVKKLAYIVDFSSGKPVSRPELNPIYKSLDYAEDTFDNLMSSREYDKFEDSFLKIKLLDPPPSQAINQLRTRFNFIVEMTTQTFEGVAPTWEVMETQSEEEICCNFIEFTRGSKPNKSEKEIFDVALAHARRGSLGHANDISEAVDLLDDSEDEE
jgi:exonuclease SbcD